jgi:hypothetical protein
VLLVKQVRQVLKVYKVLLVLQAQLAILVLQERLVQLVLLVPKAHRVFKGLQVRQVVQDQQEVLDRLEQMD